MHDLSGRTILLTGASKGIGAATARRLASEGATGAGVDLKEPAWAGAGGAYECDVSDHAAVREAFDRIATELGGLHILVNNAGITRDNLLYKMPKADWDSVLEVNLTSVFNCVQAAQRHMVAQRHGKIVSLSSRSALGNRGQANYAAAKAGMHGFTISLAQENAKMGITVNTVSPGYIGTDMVMAVPEAVREKIVAQIPTGRLGEPDEIAYAVAFFLADEAAWITGANLAANGGQYMGW